jgi:hypothetical protein
MDMAKQKFSDSEVRTFNIHGMPIRVHMSRGRDGLWHTERLIPNGHDEDGDEKTTSVPLTRGSASYEQASNDALKALAEMGL